MEFEWDPLKALTNWRKHEVLFESTTGIFDDPCALRVEDLKHSSPGEVRTWQIGESATQTLVVVFTMRGEGLNKKCRIISARRANRKEKLLYEIHKRIPV